MDFEFSEEQLAFVKEVEASSMPTTTPRCST